MSKPRCLSTVFDEINNYEIGIDEAGRGPLFGRLYVAATVLPKVAIPELGTSVGIGIFSGETTEEFRRMKDGLFHHDKMRDSKTIKSRKKIQDLSTYIKENAIAWHIEFVEADVIDTINIRQAVLMAMHECAKQIIIKLQGLSTIYNCDRCSDQVREYMLLVDGCDFTPHMIFDDATQSIREIPHETIEGGDNKYTCIAAASILAKNERDTYIENLCEQYPILHERYGIAKNMGYGTKAHRDGIEEHGITQWHRKTYGLCKTANVKFID